MSGGSKGWMKVGRMKEFSPNIVESIFRDPLTHVALSHLWSPLILKI